MTPKYTLRQKISEIKCLQKCWRNIYSSKREDVRESSRGFDNITLNQFKEKAATNLARISWELVNDRYKFSPLKGIPIRKANGNYRLVTSPSVSDRIVHKAILSAINEIFYSLVDTGVSYCGVKRNLFSSSKKKDKNHISAIKQITTLVSEKKFWIFESDIEGFFDNVPKKNLLDLIINDLPDSSINDLIKQIIFFEIGNEADLEKPKYKGKLKLPQKDCGISQGSPLSPLFSNIYLSDLDYAMKNECGMAFIRYVDDFVILANSRDEVEKLGNFAENEFKKLGLCLSRDKDESKSKTRTVNLKDGGKSIVFLGLKIDNQMITAKNPGAIKSKFNDEYLNIKLKELNRLTPQEKILLMNSRIQGCANYYAPFHCERLFLELNKLIDRKIGLPTFRGLKKIDNLYLGDQYGLPSLETWRSFFKKS